MRGRRRWLVLGVFVLAAVSALTWGAQAWFEIEREAERTVFRVQSAAIEAQAARVGGHLALVLATAQHLASHSEDVVAALWSSPAGLDSTPGHMRFVQHDHQGGVVLDSLPGQPLPLGPLPVGLHWVDAGGSLHVIAVAGTRDGGDVWVMEPAADYSSLLRSPWSWMVGPEGQVLAHADPTQVGTHPFSDRRLDPALGTMLDGMAQGGMGSATYTWSDDVDSEVRLASYASVPGGPSGVSVATSTSRDEALAGVAAARLHLGLAAGLLVLLVGAVGVLLMQLQRRSRSNERAFAEERLAMTRAAAHGERLALLGTLTAGVAHDLRGPLAAVQALFELMVEAEEDEADDLAMDLDQAIQTLTDMVQDLTSFARRQGDTCGVPAEAVRFAERMFRAKARRSVRLDVELPDLPPVTLDSRRLSQAILNLAINAQQAGAERVRITGVVVQRPGGPRVEICVEDNGPGVPPQLRERLFEAFFTTKKAGEGTGLGLHLVRSFLREAGGDVTLHDSPLGGARFCLTVPLYGPGSASDAEPTELAAR